MPYEYNNCKLPLANLFLASNQLTIDVRLWRSQNESETKHERCLSRNSNTLGGIFRAFPHLLPSSLSSFCHSKVLLPKIASQSWLANPLDRDHCAPLSLTRWDFFLFESDERLIGFNSDLLWIYRFTITVHNLLHYPPSREIKAAFASSFLGLPN